MKGRIIFAIVALFVGAFLILICYKDPVFMYGSTSCVYTTTIGILPIILFFVFCIVRYLKFNNKKIKLYVMIGIFLFWILSGRVVGFNVCDPEIVCGYHNFIATYWFHLNEEHLNTTDDLKKIHVTKRPFWRLNIKGNKINYTIYVGPFIWQESLKVFEESGFTIDGKYEAPPVPQHL